MLQNKCSFPTTDVNIYVFIYVYRPQRQHAKFVASGHYESGQKTNVGELEQALLRGYPLAVGFLERGVRPAGRSGSGNGRAVEREKQSSLSRGVVVPVIIVVITSWPFRRGRAVVHCSHRRRRHGRGCTGAIATAAGARATVAFASRVPQTDGRA